MLQAGSSQFLGLFVLMHRMIFGATDYFKISPSHAIQIGCHVAS